MNRYVKIKSKNKPVADGQQVFQDRKGRFHEFTPAGSYHAIFCCQKCSLASTPECQFAPCRYYERYDRNNGYFRQVMTLKR